MGLILSIKTSWEGRFGKGCSHSTSQHRERMSQAETCGSLRPTLLCPGRVGKHGAPGFLPTGIKGRIKGQQEETIMWF